MSGKDTTMAIVFMLICTFGIVITAILKEPYLLTMFSVLLIQKQLGRIVRAIRK